MAPKWSVVLSSVGLWGRYALAEESEVFPLSGGIDNGVTVTIDVSGFDYTAGAKVEFLTPARAVAFRWSLSDASQVERSSELGDQVRVNYGKLPAASFKTLEFTKRSDKWAVTLGGVRLPWFDFVHNHDKQVLLTHVKVYSGMQDAEVTLERKECTKKCNPDECTIVDNSTDSYIVTSGGDCSTEKETSPDQDQHCCDGQEAILPIEGLAKDSFAVIQDDSNHIKKVCTAFDASCTSVPETYTSKMVQVLEVNQDTATATVFVPFAQNDRVSAPNYELPATTKFEFPVFALKLKSPNQKLVQYGAGGDGINPFPVTCDADGHTEVVIRSEEDKVPKGWYINLVRLKVTVSGKDVYRWVRFNIFARAQVVESGQGDVSFLLTDRLMTQAGGCQDEDSWVDINDKNCSSYTENAWCNRHGEVTESGKAAFGSDSLPNGKETNYVRASLECCQCGGGRHDKPEGAQDPPTLMTEQVIE